MLTRTAIAILATVVASVSAQDTPTCEAIGYDKGTNPAFIARTDAEVTGDIEACATLCASSEECRSFAFGDNTCLLYDVAVEGNVIEMDSSPYLFNDIECFDGLVVPQPPAEEEGPEEGEGEGEGEAPPENPDEENPGDAPTEP